MNIFQYIMLFFQSHNKPKFFNTKDKNFFVVAEPEEFFKHPDPFTVYIYQKVAMNKWGIWQRLNLFIPVPIKDRTNSSKNTFFYNLVPLPSNKIIKERYAQTELH